MTALDETTFISGTDPQNPRKAADILLRLEQLQRDIAAMHKEAGRLMMFSGSIRDVLLDQGVNEGHAHDVTAGICDQVRKIRSGLRLAHAATVSSQFAIEESGADKRALFAWRPGVPGRRGGVAH